MPKSGKKAFAASSIRPKKLPGGRVQRAGKYDTNMVNLRSRLGYHIKDKRRLATILAFSRNFFVERRRFPAIGELQQVFPDLKQYSFRQPKRSFPS